MPSEGSHTSTRISTRDLLSTGEKEETTRLPNGSASISRISWLAVRDQLGLNWTRANGLPFLSVWKPAAVGSPISAWMVTGQ